VHLVLPAFTEYRRALPDCDITVTRCRAEEGYATPLPRIASDIRRYQPDLLLLTNPNNPTGGLLKSTELERWLAECLPPDTRVMLDESFLDFTREPSLAKETSQLPGLYVLQSLTKFYALPGLRLGCVIASEYNVRELEKVREPWQTSVLAEQAGMAALRDDGYRCRSLELIETERSWFEARLKRIEGLKVLRPAANFFFVQCARPVPDVQSFLLPHKILIRDLTNVEGVEGNAFRIAVRTHQDNARLLALLEEFFRSC
jgi:threonine-phosphate decarboxylase